MSTCPECGTERDESLGFCTACGRSNSNNAEVPPFMQSKRSVDNSKNKTFSVVAVVILVASVFAGIVLIGGSPDFRGTQNDDGTYVLNNTSTGIYNKTDWYEISAGGEKYLGDGNSIEWTPPAEGTYIIEMRVSTISGLKHYVDKVVRSIEKNWNYGTDSYTVKIIAVGDDYLRYRDDSVNRWPGESADTSLVQNYLRTDTENNLFQSIASQMVAQFPADATAEYKVNAVASFVQQFRYITEVDEYGRTIDYWKFPLETIYDMGGDCEDLAILCMALTKHVFAKEGKSVSVALALYWGSADGKIGGHAMAAIALDSEPVFTPTSASAVKQNTGLGYKVGDKTYYVCETTAKEWKVGEIHKDYGSYDMTTKMGKLIPV